MRGGSVSLARDLAATAPIRRCGRGVQHARPRCVPRHGETSCGATWVQYLHENQLTYPRQPGESLDAGLAWMQWRSLVVADEIWCNSAFQRDELIAGLDRLLPPPDHGHEPERAALEAKLRIEHPGVDIRERRSRPTGAPRPLVVSNQRWHHDKDVGAVIRTVRRLLELEVDLDLAVVGDNEGGEAAVIDPLLDGLGDRVVALGSSIGPITSRFSIVPTSSCRRPKARTSASPWWRRSRPGPGRCCPMRSPTRRSSRCPTTTTVSTPRGTRAARRGHRPQCGGGVCAGWARRGDGGPCVAGDRRADESSTRRTPPAMSRAA